MSKNYLKQFVLVGGTALALQIKHRVSIDLDLFTILDFSSKNLLPSLLKNYNLQIISQMPQTIICKIRGIKVDFIRFKYPVIRPVIEFDGLRIISLEDIAAMKLDSIAGRGSKKDFFDIYFLLQHFDLKSLFSLYKEKYPHQTTFHVARSLAYFVDAERDPDPLVYNKKISWLKVKKKIATEIQKL